MTSFMVTAFGDSFSTVARCPSSLRAAHFPGRSLRCWVRMTTATGGFFWLETPLDGSPIMFDAIRPMLGKKNVLITFRGKGENPTTLAQSRILSYFADDEAKYLGRLKL